ncbi:DUF6932 family protein [Glutamicibacter arilaitensis]|uniref:DUF6932 family protein n=1 Tax=Glutamicibacter arilaitensis TaxID=256701 RepID=UPI003F911AD3
MTKVDDAGSPSVQIPWNPETKALPAGRYNMSTQEAQSIFCFNEHREALWSEWEEATSLLRSHVPICKAWLGGSFFTDKSQPGDIDCVYFVDSAHLDALSDESKNILGAFASGSAVKEHLKLRVDTFVVPWSANSTPMRDHPAFADYYLVRGYWDDLWSKMRSGSKGAAPVRLDSHPRRGYLEVTIDGFSEEGSFYAG